MDLLTTTYKVLPPARPEPSVVRRRLSDLLDGILSRRVTCLLAGAGFGKSTALAAWMEGRRGAWYTAGPEDATMAVFGRGLVDALRVALPGLSSEVVAAADGLRAPHADEKRRAEAFAGLLCSEITAYELGPIVLIVDDVHELPPGGTSARVLEALGRQAPGHFHLVLSSRAQLPLAVDRLRGRGQVLDIGAAELAFSESETKELLAGIGVDAYRLTPRLYRMTAGWPAAIHLAIEALRAAPTTDHARIVEGLPGSGGPLFDYLAHEVIEQEGEQVKSLLQRMAPLTRFNVDLCEELGLGGVGERLPDWERRGVLVTSERLDDLFTLKPLVRDYARQHLPLPREAHYELLTQAALWYEKNGLMEDALVCYRELGAVSETANLLREHGASAVDSGAVQSVLDAYESLPAELRDPAIHQTAGQARLVQGDWDAALECFERATEKVDHVSAGLAWRMGLIHYLRGDLEEARRVFEQVPAAEQSGRDRALLLGWKASAEWVMGDRETCIATAAAALQAAKDSNDPQALAAAHTVLAMQAAVDGDRRTNETHYFLAHRAAEKAGDVLQLIRIGANRAAHYNEEGAFAEALAEIDRVMPLAETAGFAVFLGLCFNNRGDAMVGLGRLEEALSDYEAAKAIYERIGSTDLGFALVGLGDVYRERAHFALARGYYEEAARTAGESRDTQIIVPALAGLARVIAADDPAEALSVADRAISYGANLGYVKALLAKGWAGLAGGDHELATTQAGLAAKAARERRDRAGLAESLELEGLSATEVSAAAARLAEASELWGTIGNPLGQSRARLRLAVATGDAGAAQTAVLELLDLGVRVPEAPRVLTAERLPPVVVQTLGGLRLIRDGRPVPSVEWQSKKARDLLKMLIARRGHKTPREWLMETLWPDDDPTKLANRLSVALTTVRTILDPDRHFESEHFIVSDKQSVGLDLDHLQVDVETFLESANRGLSLVRQRRDREGIAILASAEQSYTGDFLEEDPYEDWSVALREEARALYISVARILAHSAADDRDYDSASRYFLRLLERDPFDEDAHLGLVTTLQRAGRHGDARRSYRMYVSRMLELGVESAPFPGERTAPL